MKIETGYLYHIKDEFFDIVDDENLMSNHERGRKRPTYFTIRDEDILWFIPLSTKVDKYKKIVDRKIAKFGFCSTILIKTIYDEESAILLQNAFPTLEKYIDHIHTINGKPAKVPETIEKLVIDEFKNLITLKEKGINLFFTDIDKIKKQMLDELENNGH